MLNSLISERHNVLAERMGNICTTSGSHRLPMSIYRMGGGGGRVGRSEELIVPRRVLGGEAGADFCRLGCYRSIAELEHGILMQLRDYCKRQGDGIGANIVQDCSKDFSP